MTTYVLERHCTPFLSTMDNYSFNNSNNFPKRIEGEELHTLPKLYDSYKCFTCTEFSEAFSFLMENIYVQFDGIVYNVPTNSRDSYGHKLCFTYSRLIFILLREGLYVKPPEIQTV